MTDIRIEKSYYEHLVRDNHTMTIRCVEAMKDLKSLHSIISDRIKSLEAVIGGKTDTDDDILYRRPVLWESETGDKS